MPSIMIPIDTALGITHYDITNLDVSEIKSIYGDGGFGPKSSSYQFDHVPMLTTDKQTYQANDLVKISVDTSQFNNETLAQLLVIDSNNSLKGIGNLYKSNSTLYLDKITDKDGRYQIELIDPTDAIYDFTTISVGEQSSVQTSTQVTMIPSWIKSNAKWWSEGSISDNDFIKGIQYLIQQNVVTIPPTQSGASISKQIPAWVKNNAGFWAGGQISDDDFVKAIQYLVSNGIIRV